ncbi:hypothetical protein CMO89_03300 [Candidatus Woesearchaeota archaeon]|nr:hypothetical protein [Candidatus Woesearchaeota archaeon]|tara:strand:- start:2475 stop:3143 length:669 start_codon:yes stop_codon:yes gene_type:complete
MPVKNLSSEEQPREKLVKFGAKNLSNVELLAMVLRVGDRKNNVVEVSRKILNKFDLKELSRVSFNQIKGFKGIKTAKACQIIACFELARRLASYQECKGAVLSSGDIVKAFKSELSYLKKEVFLGVYLNARNYIIRKEEISVGTLDMSLVNPREVFGPALTDGAKSVILVHNHPSGDAMPSEADLRITKQIKRAGDLLGISVVDHIIIGSEDYISFHDKDLM